MAKQIIILATFIICASASANVNAQTELIYKGGVYQNDIKLTSAEVKEIMKDDKDALSKYKSGKSLRAAAIIIAVPSTAYTIGGLGLIIMTIDPSSDMDKLVRIAGVGSMVVGGLGLLWANSLSNSGTNKMKQAVEIYNTNINSNKVSVNVGLMGNGVGLNVSF